MIGRQDFGRLKEKQDSRRRYGAHRERLTLCVSYSLSTTDFSMSTIRQERVAALLFEELSILIGGELDDPKLTLTNVTDVTISRDLRNAKVYVTNDDDDVTSDEVLSRLRRATPFLRGEIATRLSLRGVPELLFYYDSSPQRAARIDAILREISEERASTPDDTQP